MGDYTVKRFEDMHAKMGGGFKLARASLGVTSFGMQIIVMPPNSEFHPDHDHLHDGQEEVYVVLDGGGNIAIDGEQVALAPDMAVRVAPGSKRQLLPGDEGMRVLVVGGVPGRPYEAPAYTEPKPAEEGGA
ncbi:MAG TPA: cupin domain-containing protein [Solirubrobacteraceae bacterium]|jgi:mannose-6-phosphate isomerase-like protein (cupin superfamily)